MYALRLIWSGSEYYNPRFSLCRRLYVPREGESGRHGDVTPGRRREPLRAADVIDDADRAEVAGFAAGPDDVEMVGTSYATTLIPDCSSDVSPEAIVTDANAVGPEWKVSTTDAEDWATERATACGTDPESWDDESSDTSSITTEIEASTDASAAEDEAAASASDIAASEPEDWDAEMAAAPAVVPSNVLIAAPATLSSAMQGAGLTHVQAVNCLLRIPYLQELGLYQSIVPMLEDEREGSRKLRRKLAVCEKLLGMETSATMRYQRAVAEYGAHTSMGNEPSTNLRDWIEDMRQNPFSFAARPIDDMTCYDVIVQVRESMDILEDNTPNTVRNWST